MSFKLNGVRELITEQAHKQLSQGESDREQREEQWSHSISQKSEAASEVWAAFTQQSAAKGTGKTQR